MNPNLVPYALPIFAIATLTGVIAIYAFFYFQRSGARAFAWINVCMTVWSVCHGIGVLAPTLSAKVRAAQWEYVSFAILPVFWLVFALEHNGRKAWLTPSRLFALCAIPALTITLSLTNGSHHLMIESARLDTTGHPVLRIESHGDWFWVHIIYSYILGLGGLTLYGSNFSLKQPAFQNQIKLIAAGTLAVLGLNVISLVGPFDLTPVGFAATGILAIIGYFRVNFLWSAPTAPALVLENLHDAVIIVNNQMLVIYINAAARDWWQLGDEIIGREARASLPMLAPIWDNWQAGQAVRRVQIDKGGQARHFNASLMELHGLTKKATGWAVIAQDITHEQELLKIETSHAHQMEIINSITRLALETASLEGLLDNLAKRLKELLDADGAYIALWDEDNQCVVSAAAHPADRGGCKSIALRPGELTLASSVLHKGQVLAIEDVHNTPYMKPHSVERCPARSIMALPLIANERKLGAALIAFDQARIFDKWEVTLGEQVADQLSFALDKARLFDRLFRHVVQLSLLQQLSEKLAKSQDEEDVYETTVKAIVDVFGYDEAAISILTDDNYLELVTVGGAKDFGFQKGFRQEIGQGIIGHIAKTSRPYFTANVKKDAFYYHPKGEGAGAAIGVPVHYDDKLIGVIYVQNESSGSILKDDIPVLETLANHLAIAIQKIRLHAETHAHLTAARSLQAISQIVISSLELEKIFKIAVSLLQENYGYSHVSIYQIEGEILRLGAQVGYPSDVMIHQIRVSTGVTGRAVRTRQTQFLPDVRNDPAFLRASHDVQSEICVPLLKDDHVLGVLNVESTESHSLTARDVELLEAFARPVAMALDNARLHARVKSMALTDGLTGLINRRAFDQALDTELARAARYRHPLSLIILDIDSFKVYNDLHGHPAGDERLKSIAAVLSENVRYPDVVARYGGEEFAIVLPHTDKAEALIIAERLRVATALQVKENPPPLGIPVAGFTISQGVASYPHDGNTVQELLLAADNAELYAKRMGKNQVGAASAS